MGLSAGEHVQRFFADPAAHCVGYGRMAIGQPPATTADGGGAGGGVDVDATVDMSVGIEPLSQPSEEGEISEVSATGTAVLEAGEVVTPAEAVVAALEAASERASASVSRVLREHSPAIIASIDDVDYSLEGDERSSEASTTSAACSDLMVSAARIPCLTSPSL